MPLDIERYGDVQRLRMNSLGSRLAGMDVSAYVIRGVMIDTGFHHARRALVRAVDALRVRGAIVTHWHEDHAGNVALLASRGLPVVMRADTETHTRALPPIRLYRRVVWGSPPALVSTLTAFDTDGLECIHTPGHSSDHQIVWDARTRTLFSGDLWLGVRARVIHATEDPYLIIESLRTILALEPARMFDAHRGAVVVNPVRAIREKIDWLSTTLGEIERRIVAGESDRAILREVLGGDGPAAIVSRGDWSSANLVKAVRTRVYSDQSSPSA